MKLNRIEVFVFDMGGVLYDTPREVFLMTQFILRELSKSQSQEYTEDQIKQAIDLADEVFDKRLVEMNVDPYWLPSFEDSVEYDRLLLEQLQVQGNLGNLATEVHRKWLEALPKMMPKFIEPCRAVLETLHSSGYKMAIASNRRNDPIPRLTSDSILHHFDAVEYSCIPGYRKPSPFMLIQIASKLGVNPERCAYIGDKVEPDVEAARRAGFLPILLIWCDPKEGEKAQKDGIVIEHIDELLDFFH